ncbi:hypothetical protein KKC91_00210 [bacterium]|nr:hypothetical protein [bacterium]
MMTEKSYEFRRYLDVVHLPDRANFDLKPEKDELIIEEGWSIVVSRRASQLVLNVAKDLQDYLLVSMNVSVLLRRVSDVASAADTGKKIIVLAAKEELPKLGDKLSVPRSYRIIYSQERVIVCGNDERGVGQGSYYIEDLMNLREAPILQHMDVIRKPVFSPRMTHSGWGLDNFPDNYLNLVAHSGMDSILLFVKGVDQTPLGYQDFNNLVDRAARFGLDVYFYSYLKSLKHPDEADAESYYESTYGAIFKACPRAKGVILVGESCAFPSKDPNTTQSLLPSTDGIPSAKPDPWIWPCCDYAEWLNMIKKVVRKHSPDAEIVFWTYNWGWAPEKERLKLIRSLPKDITLLVTFEMFEQIKREGITNACMDYTISFEGPGKYFTSEAKAARERGIQLYAMSNTGGLTWDYGVIPYEPVPYQWARRYNGLLSANKEWGLLGLMESHHYGWYPSFVSELAKWAFWSPGSDIKHISEAIAQRDFGIKAVPQVLKAWKYWSEAIQYYVVTNEDQYGPFRIGPSFPLVFQQDVKIPSSWHAHFGGSIIRTNYKSSYRPYRECIQSYRPSRVDVEIRTLQKMVACWQKGVECMQKAVDIVPEKKRSNTIRLLNLGTFILNSTITAIHVKSWWKLNNLLATEASSKKAHAILDKMTKIAKKEIDNAEATIPLVEMDSRLGWEPSMEYMTDKAHLEWKVRQVRNVIENGIPQYRKLLW